MYVEGADDIFYSLHQYENGFITKYTWENKVKEIIEGDKGILFYPDAINPEIITQIKRTFDELVLAGVNVKNKFIGINLYIDECYLSKSNCSLLSDVKQHMSKFGADLVIVAEDLFELDQIITTNLKLDAEIDYINSLKVPTENNRPLNDMEKFLLVYDFCTNFKYQENEEHREYARNITSIMNSSDIVCVGYAAIMKEMCNRLGIECFTVSSIVKDKTTGYELGGHQNNIVVLNGQLYYADACWDCYRPEAKGLKMYNHCLIPVDDRSNFKAVEVVYTDYGCSWGNKQKYIDQAKKYLTDLQEGTKDIQDELKMFLIKFKKIFEESDIKPVKFDVLHCQETDYAEYGKQINLQNQTQELISIVNYFNKYEYGGVLSLDDFERALYNIYLAKGMAENKAKNLLYRTMELNERRAKKTFNANATNCFAAGKQQELEI